MNPGAHHIEVTSPDPGGALRSAQVGRPVVVVAHPDEDQEVRGVSHEPGVPKVAGCPRLARAFEIYSELFQRFRRTPFHDPFQEIGYEKGLFRRGEGRVGIAELDWLTQVHVSGVVG